MTAYTFDLPRSFNPVEFLPPRLALHGDDARWFVSTILRKMTNRDVDERGWVRLHSSVLLRVMNERTMPEIIRSLNQGAIETAPYLPTVKCRGFRLSKRYHNDRCVRVRVHDPDLLGRLEKERQRLKVEEDERRALWLPIHRALNAEQRRLTIDPEAASAILVTLPVHTRLCQDVLVSRIRHREFTFRVGSTGRVFNAICNLKRELRSAVRIGGEPMGGVDMMCAQPTLLYYTMTQPPTNGLKGVGTYRGVELPPSPLPLREGSKSKGSRGEDLFGSLACSGGLYEYLMGQTGLDRETVKRKVMVDVLAKRGRYPSPVESAFRHSFPEVYRYIRHVNRDDHGELSRRLQRKESSVVVEHVAPRLIGRVPCVTLHDAIYSTLPSLPAVEDAFNDTFAELSLNARTKRE